MEKVFYVLGNIGSTNMFSLGLGVLTILVVIACKKWNKNLPGALIGIMLSIVIVVLFDLDKAGVKLTGDIPSSLPPFKLFNLDINSARELLSGALAIAIIGLVEAISIAKSISSTSREKINPNQEFIGQGIANVAGSFFQCFASSGSFTRSAVNYYSGAATRFSGILSGVIVAIILFFFAPYAKYIPMPSLAGVIMTIAYSMVNKKEMRKVYKVGKSDSVVMWLTFGATVLMPDLDWAIYMGIIISIALYLRDTNKVPVKILVPSTEAGGYFREREIDTVKTKEDILIVQIEGNLYFGSAYDLEHKLETLVDKARVFILRMKSVTMIDITSLDTLKVFIRRIKENGGTVLVCGVSTGLNSMLLNSELTDEIGEENIFMFENEVFASSKRAIEKAQMILKEKQPSPVKT